MIANQQAHIIKLTCQRCNGTGKEYPKEPMTYTTGLKIIYIKCECDNPMREYLVWMPNRNIIDLVEYTDDDELCTGVQCINSKGTDAVLSMDHFLSDFSPYKSGSTIPTKDGDRVAGEVT